MRAPDAQCLGSLPRHLRQKLAGRVHRHCTAPSPAIAADAEQSRHYQTSSISNCYCLLILRSPIRLLGEQTRCSGTNTNGLNGLGSVSRGRWLHQHDLARGVVYLMHSHDRRMVCGFDDVALLRTSHCHAYERCASGSVTVADGLSNSIQCAAARRLVDRQLTCCRFARASTSLPAASNPAMGLHSPSSSQVWLQHF